MLCYVEPVQGQMFIVINFLKNIFNMGFCSHKFGFVCLVVWGGGRKETGDSTYLNSDDIL